MAYGFVYILTNPVMPGIVKIGCTERSPTMRALELSNASGVPAPFQVFGYIEVADHQAVEREMHSQWDKERVSSNREFFRADALDVWQTLIEYETLACAETENVGIEEHFRRCEVSDANTLASIQAVASAMFGNVHDWWFDMDDDIGNQRIEVIPVDAVDNVIAFGRRAA
jgi:hypothetical protein